MARTATRLGLQTRPRVAFGCRWGSLALTLALAPACNRPSSDNIALWKTTEKGPERLHDALADHGVAPRLRAEAAVALVDIGRSDDVASVLGGAPADDRSEISKTLEPAYEVAMKDPTPEKALAYRDALFALRKDLTPDEQKRIDAALLPSLEADLKAGKLRQGQNSIDKMLSAIGADAGAMLVRVLGDAEAPYFQAAELLAKVGDDGAREQGAVALVARASKIKAAEKQHPDNFYKALGSLGGPTAVKMLEAESAGADKDRALLATRALGERRDPMVLPFALKVAGEPQADKAVRDEMFGVIEGSAAWRPRRACWGSSRPTRRRSCATGPSSRSWRPARRTESCRRWRRFRSARPIRRSMWTICWSS
jgi:hypothetical protein